MYAISFDLCTALMDHLYLELLLPHLRAPYINTLIVWEFCKLAFGNYGLLAITAPNY